MKDAEARERVEKLEDVLANLPAQVAQVVVAHFEPIIAQVNQALTAMDEQSNTITARLAKLERAEHDPELFQVIESELNSLRVDVNAQREAVVNVAAQAGKVHDRVESFLAGVARVASSA